MSCMLVPCSNYRNLGAQQSDPYSSPNQCVILKFQRASASRIFVLPPRQAKLLVLVEYMSSCSSLDVLTRGRILRDDSTESEEPLEIGEESM